MLALFLQIRRSMPEPVLQLGLFLLFVCIGTPLTYLLSRAKVATAHEEVDGG